jgi:uncharacterized protein (TIGR03545 family)
MSRRLKVFRWRAVGPLLMFLVLLAVLYVLCIDRIARGEVRDSLSQMLGTQVDLAGLTIRTRDAAVDLAGLAIADPRDPGRNLLAADSMTLDLDPAPLTEKKLVIDRLRLSGLRLLTARATRARPADPNGPAATLLQETEHWAGDRFRFPALALARVDTLKSLVLDPKQLASVQAARALVARMDSLASASGGSRDLLRLRPLLDSATNLAGRIRALDVRRLDVLEARELIVSLRKTDEGIAQARAQVQAVVDTARGALAALGREAQAVGEARERDYAFVRGLFHLPSVAAPDIGLALFGAPSAHIFQQLLYCTRLVDRYVPPGLQAWNRPGPPRARLAGTTVEFPKRQRYPRFLLRQGDLTASAGPGLRDRFHASVTGITSQPALLGQPARLSASGRLGDGGGVMLDLAATSRHFGAAPIDSVAARATGVTLPPFDLPGLHFRVAPGSSAVGLAFSLAGERLSGRWEIRADSARWSRDSASGASPAPLEDAVWQVMSGLSSLQVVAELGGTVSRPVLLVHSNLDEAIAARLRALLGEELQRVDRKARAAVDALTDSELAALRSRLDEFKGQALESPLVEQGQLDEAQRLLEAQLKRLTTSAAGGLRLPKL